MSYVEALQALRQKVQNTDPVAEAAKAMQPVSPRGFMPAIASSSSRAPVSDVPQYAPLDFARDSMREIHAASQRFQEARNKDREREASKQSASGGPAAAALSGFVARRNQDQAQSSSEPTATDIALSTDDVNGLRDGSQGPAGGPEAIAEGGGGGLLNLIDSTEGGGSYDTLFGHSQRDGPFAGTRVSQMTIGELKEFAGARGEGSYGSWVQSTNPEGVLATPMGRYQFVGTTLASTAEAMGLPDDTVFDQQTQDAMFSFKVRERLNNADTLAGKRQQLRNEWHGFRNVSNSVLDQAILDFENEV